jgi:CheY-like chemotaxis protein
MLRDLGYSTLEAADGQQALDRLTSHPQWVILDQQMRGFTGLEVLQAIRSGRTAVAHNIPVLMLTGHADKDIVRIAGELDVSALLTKPVSKALLRERMLAVEMHPAADKPPESYACVKVPTNVPEAPPPRTQGRAWVTMTPAGAGDAASGGSAGNGAATADTPRAGDMHYSRIRPGMILGKSLFSESGQLMLAAGLELTTDMVKRLVRKCEHDPALQFLAVVPARRGGRQKP